MIGWQRLALAGWPCGGLKGFAAPWPWLIAAILASPGGACPFLALAGNGGAAGYWPSLAYGRTGLAAIAADPAAPAYRAGAGGAGRDPYSWPDALALALSLRGCDP